jgi:hypothetical protein
MEIGNGPRIGIVARPVAQPAVTVGNPHALIFGKAEIARSPAFDQHLPHVGDAALGAGFDHPGIMARHLRTGGEFIADDPRLNTLDRMPVPQYVRAQIGNTVPGFTGFGIIAAEIGAAPLRLGRLMQGNGLESCPYTQTAITADDRHGTGNLGFIERVKPVSAHHTRPRKRP